MQAALFLQDFTSFDLSPQFRSISGTSSGINTVFQILLQPEPSAGFEYSWRTMDDVLAGDAGQFQPVIWYEWVSVRVHVYGLPFTRLT